MQNSHRKWYNGINTNAFRYCGEYYDSEMGTIYLRARHYNPNNGRFTQRDSFAGKQGDPLSLNLYTYCHNNPIRYIDPSGHFVIALPALVVAAAAVVVVSTTAIVVSNNPQAQQSFNEMTYDVERGLKDLVDSSKKALNKVKTWGKSLAVKAKHTYETTKTVATVVGTSIITNVVTDAILFYAKRTSTSTTGEPNTTVDRTDKDGNVIGDRTYGPDGRADTDTDYTDHGNPKEHPVVPHKHRWDWTNKKPRGSWEKP